MGIFTESLLAQATPWAMVCRRGWRRTYEPTYVAAFSRTVSPRYGVRTVATNGYSRIHVRPVACARHATWLRSPPGSPITCCLTLPVRQWVLSLPKRLRPFLEGNPDIAGAVSGSSSVPCARPCAR